MFGHFLMTAVDEILQFLQEHDCLFVLVSPAGICTQVADRSAGRYLNQQGIIVAVGLDGFDVQEISAFFSLGPQALLGTAVKSHLSAFYRFLIGFFVHESQHEYFLGMYVLDDGGNQSSHFVEIKFHRLLF